jgi:hypothetical protein
MKSGFSPEAILLVRAATFLQRLFIGWNRDGITAGRCRKLKRLGKCDSQQARAKQDKTGNGHCEETVRSKFFTHGTPPTARKSDCDARKADVGSQSAEAIKFCFRKHFGAGVRAGKYFCG